MKGQFHGSHAPKFPTKGGGPDAQPVRGSTIPDTSRGGTEKNSHNGTHSGGKS